jgi:hypothetical protein
MTRAGSATKRPGRRTAIVLNEYAKELSGVQFFRDTFGGNCCPCQQCIFVWSKIDRTGVGLGQRCELSALVLGFDVKSMCGLGEIGVRGKL